jgi:hypothetical protein
MTDFGPYDGSEGVQGNTVTTGTQWTSIAGTATFDAAGARNGLGYRWVEASAITWSGYKTITSSSQVAGRVNFTFNSLPVTRDLIVTIDAAFANNSRFGVDGASHPVVKDSAGTVLATGAAALSAGVNYGCELQMDVGTTTANGTINCQVYALSAPGTLLLSFASTTVNAGAGSNVIRGQVGNDDPVTIDITFDDILWRTGTLTPVGPVTTDVNVILLPSGTDVTIHS